MVIRGLVAAVVMSLLGAFVNASSALTRAQPSRGPSSVAPRYPRGARGYDVSYPNCGRRLAFHADFAVVGLNGGRPFTFNPCVRREYARYAHTGAVDLYLNTGYDSWFPRVVHHDCARAAHGRAHPVAYAVGCSEAEASLAHLRWLGVPPPRVWWIDVEPSNTWSSSRVFNTTVLRGMVARLLMETPRSIVGVYSMRSWWRQITRGWHPSIPEWIPRSRGVSCAAPFAEGPVWISQTGSRAIDSDVAC